MRTPCPIGTSAPAASSITARTPDGFRSRPAPDANVAGSALVVSWTNWESRPGQPFARSLTGVGRGPSELGVAPHATPMRADIPTTTQNAGLRRGRVPSIAELLTGTAVAKPGATIAVVS